MGFILPENYNPADFYIRSLAVLPGNESESRKNIREICASFSTSEEAKCIEEKIQKEIKQLDYLTASTSSTCSEEVRFTLFHYVSKLL